MDATTWLWFAAGLVLLIGGAELLVRGASRLALILGLSPLVIGLTVVALGTSAPEIAVGVQASVNGKADIAVGNVVGSNVFNLLFILGLSALLRPLVVTRHLIRWDVPIMILSAVAMLVLGLDGRIGRGDGIGLLAAGGAYMLFLVLQSKLEPPSTEQGFAETIAPKRPGKGAGLVSLVLVLAGLAALVLGSRWLVSGSVQLARSLGVSELIISITIIAAGTSLPEVATSVIATLRGEREIAIGNVVGSSIFNVLVVLGAASAVSSNGVQISPIVLRLDLPVMVAVSLACLPIFFTGHRISRMEGLLFLIYYAAYTGFLVMQATRHSRLDELVYATLFLVIPISVIGIAVSVVRHLRSREPG
jgi:cation:H+ antiporter